MIVATVPIDNKAKRRPPASVGDELVAVLPQILEPVAGAPQRREPRGDNHADNGDHYERSGDCTLGRKDERAASRSATPYIFTFKLWDWGQTGLDGKARPIHLEHGLANIEWDRTADWVAHNLVDRVNPIAAGDGWREESTGLHPLEFIETRRHWFTAAVEHDTGGTVNVLNLVEGAAVAVESPADAFEPMTVHYAETFVVPASVGAYRVRPLETAPLSQLATIKAYVRSPVPR